MKLRITVEGATAEELQRGAKAAEDFFREKGVTAMQCAEAAFAREGWDIRGFPEDGPKDRTMRLAKWWDLADEVAAEVCCRGWPKRPSTANLEFDRDDDPAMRAAQRIVGGA